MQINTGHSGRKKGERTMAEKPIKIITFTFFHHIFRLEVRQEGQEGVSCEKHT